MSQIGSIEFIRMQGAIDPGIGETLREITRPGVNGVAYRKEGIRGESFRLNTDADFASAGAAKTHKETCQSMQGEIYDIIDDHGQTWEDFIVLSVIPYQTSEVKNRQGGSGSGDGYLVRQVWLMRATDPG